MLCLSDSIRHDDPSVQPLLRAIEEAHTLTQLIIAVWPLARVLAQHIVEYVLAERAQRPIAWPPCPTCGTLLRSKGFAQRQLTSLVGPLRWRRRVGRCPHGCDIPQVAPFDAVLGVQPHQRTSGELQCLGCALAVFVPFATAARLLGWYCGSVVSPRAVWCWVQAAGHQAMEHLQAELAAVAQGHGPTPEPLTAEEAALGNIETLKPRLWLEALRQGIIRAPQVVWLSDGGRGLWRLFEEQFSASAMGILDFYHAAQNLWKSAAAWLDGRTTKAHRWFAWARHRLRHGNPDGVLADLADALDVEGLPDTARATLTTVYAYLERHRDHIDYATYKELGLPLGSGMVESACKWLIQQRFKGVGMRWSEDGFNHLLHLRLAWVNGSFEALFQVQLHPSPNT